MCERYMYYIYCDGNKCCNVFCTTSRGPAFHGSIAIHVAHSGIQACAQTAMQVRVKFSRVQIEPPGTMAWLPFPGTYDREGLRVSSLLHVPIVPDY